MPTASGVGRQYWQTQHPIDYLDTTIVQNAWETVTADLSAGAPAKLFFIIVEQTNNGAAAEDIEVEITMNGTAYTWTVAANSGTQYFLQISMNLAAGDFETTYGATSRGVKLGNVSQYASDGFIARTVGLIRVRQTSAVDPTSAQIELNIIWDRLVNW